MMDNLDSTVSVDLTGEKADAPRDARQAKQRLVEALAQTFSVGNVDYSSEALGARAQSLGYHLNDRQIAALRDDLVVYLDHAGVNAITTSEIQSWTDSVKSRIARQLAPYFESGDLDPTYSVVRKQLSKHGYVLENRKIHDVLADIQSNLEKNAVTGGRKQTTLPLRMTDVKKVKLAETLRPHFIAHGDYISHDDVRQKLAEIGHQVRDTHVKAIRKILVDSLGLKAYKIQSEKALVELLSIAKKLAHYFVQSEAPRPKRGDLIAAGKSMGIEIPYWRTDTLLQMVLEAAPSLAKRKGRGRSTGGSPQPIDSRKQRRTLKISLGEPSYEFSVALCESLGMSKQRHVSEVIELMTLALAHGLYNGTVDIHALLAGARNISPSEIDIAVRMMRRLNLKTS